MPPAGGRATGWRWSAGQRGSAAAATAWGPLRRTGPAAGWIGVQPPVGMRPGGSQRPGLPATGANRAPGPSQTTRTQAALSHVDLMLTDHDDHHHHRPELE